MGNGPAWLKEYYGKDFDFLSPAVVFEGERMAVVKLSRTGERGFSSVGYVLINKNGRHSASPHRSLHEGMPSSDQLAKMKKLMEQEDD